jgi:hypothetical protein
MSADRTSELHDFHRFLGEQLSAGAVKWSPEEALDEWRRLHPDVPESDEELAAIQEALTAQVEGDRGIPFEEFDRDFRARHDLPGSP